MKSNRQHLDDQRSLQIALQLARRGYGETSPNPMVGAILVKGGLIIGQGWHHRAGKAHAEIEALSDAKNRGFSTRGATLYVTLEPCSSHGRTPPCTDAIIAAGIRRVFAGTADPNPKHAGRGFDILRRAGIVVDELGDRPPARRSARDGTPRKPALADDSFESSGVAGWQKISRDCTRLNEAFNHWIVQRTPFVTVKAAMTLDGKIATADGESKWITGEKARGLGMKLRRGHDAILVGVKTILADNPMLTARSGKKHSPRRRIVLDSLARTPLEANVVKDEYAADTTIVVGKFAPKHRTAALAKKVNVMIAPVTAAKLNLRWLLKKLGAQNITSLLVEGGGEVNASFLLGGLAQRVAFFYAPKILGGQDSRKAVAGDGVKRPSNVVRLRELEWQKIGVDLFLTARAD